MDNSSNITDSPLPPRGPGYKPFCGTSCLIAFNMIVFIAGLAGNGSIMYIVSRHKGLRTIPNLLITNLALGDLLVIITLVLYNIVCLFYPILYTLTTGCEWMYFIQFISLSVSVLTLTALSIDRLITVVKPMYKQRENVKMRTIGAVIAIWLISGVLVAPLFYLISLDPARPCDFPFGTLAYDIYVCVFFLVAYAIPTIIMVSCYTLTARKLLRRSQLLNRDSRGGLRQHQQRSRLAIIVLIMTIAFILCTSIFFLRMMIANFAPNHPMLDRRFTPLAEAMVLLMKLNSCINPIILYLMSTTHRRYFLRHFCCCIVGKEVTRPRTATNGTSSQVSSNTWLRSTKLGIKSTSEKTTFGLHNLQQQQLLQQHQQHQQQQQLQPLNPTEREHISVAKL